MMRSATFAGKLRHGAFAAVVYSRRVYGSVVAAWQTGLAAGALAARAAAL